MQLNQHQLDTTEVWMLEGTECGLERVGQNATRSGALHLRAVQHQSGMWAITDIAGGLDAILP